MRRALALVTAISTSGCSFALVSGPPDNHRQLPVVDCTESRVGPVLDAIWTGLNVANMLALASQSDEERLEQYDGDPPYSRTTNYVLNASMAILGAAGMYYGFTRTGTCREAKAEWRKRVGPMYGYPPYGAPYGYPPAPPQGGYPPSPPQGTWPPPPQQPAPVQPATPVDPATAPTTPLPAQPAPVAPTTN